MRLRARKALAAVQPSSARGRRAKRLALAAFYDYAIVGRQWALSGQARVRGLRTAAVGHARIAARYARRAGTLLLVQKDFSVKASRAVALATSRFWCSSARRKTVRVALRGRLCSSPGPSGDYDSS